MNPDVLRTMILRQLDEDLDCEATDGRIVCNVPLSYPDGDGVTVYVTERDGKFEVTDYSEGLRAALTRPSLYPQPVARLAEGICQSLGVHFMSGRVSGLTNAKTIGDIVWRVALASTRIAEAQTYLRGKPPRESKFVQEVEAVLRPRYADVQRETRLPGASGHNHRITFLIPPPRALLEPIESEGAWAQASAVYVKFGDIGKTNGFRFLSLLDDRSKHPEQDVTNLLLQVSEVLLWSMRDKWINRLAGK